MYMNHTFLPELAFFDIRFLLFSVYVYSIKLPKTANNNNNNNNNQTKKRVISAENM
jgi:hypothetical protein